MDEDFHISPVLYLDPPRLLCNSGISWPLRLLKFLLSAFTNVLELPYYRTFFFFAWFACCYHHSSSSSSMLIYVVVVYEYILLVAGSHFSIYIAHGTIMWTSCWIWWSTPSKEEYTCWIEPTKGYLRKYGRIFKVWPFSRGGNLSLIFMVPISLICWSFEVSSVSGINILDFALTGSYATTKCQPRHLYNPESCQSK